MILTDDIDFVLAYPTRWEQFFGATVIISGASGILPAYMVETLLELGRRNPTQAPRVVGLVRNLDGAQARFRHHRDNPNLQLVAQDLTQPLIYDGAADFIVHAASQASPRFYRDDPVGTFEANITGTRELLSLARRKSARGFLFFSSGEVYGQATQVPTPETAFGPVDPAALRSCYAEGKRAGETMCVAWASQYGVPARIVRPFHTYGPGMKLDDGRIFADFVAAILSGQELLIKSDGTARRPYCYITDAVRAFFLVLLEGENGLPYNVGNDKAEVSIRELADALVAEFAEKNLRVVMDASKAAANYMQSPISRNCPDITRLRAKGWEPEIGIAEGFRRTVESYGETSPGIT